MILDWKLPERIEVLPGTYSDDGICLNQRRYHRYRDGLSVIATMENHEGKYWLHVSCAYNDKRRGIPSFETLKEVKNIFIGRHRKAIQILPSEKEYVNVHPRCLHLFTCSEDDGLPDFTHEGML
jgi:hypothetical protein